MSQRIPIQINRCVDCLTLSPDERRIRNHLPVARKSIEYISRDVTDPHPPLNGGHRLVIIIGVRIGVELVIHEGPIKALSG
jgi:hypothetical protein